MYQVEPVMWTWYIVLYKHHYDMHVVSLSNISIKTNNKGQNKIIKFVQYSEGDYILCMTSRLFVAVHSFALLSLLTFTCFTHRGSQLYFYITRYMLKEGYPAFQWYEVMTKYFGREDLVQRRGIFYYQCGGRTSFIRQATFFKFKWKRTKC